MGANKKIKSSSINIKNKRATFDYQVIDKYTAGIVLTGTEIKSIRAGKAGLQDICLVRITIIMRVGIGNFF